MFDVVLTAFDDSPSSSAAVTWAADEAVARGAQLEVLSCDEVPWVGQPPVTVERVRAVAQATDERLQRVSGEVRAAHPDLHVVASVGDGRPRHSIAESAGHADLVVVGAGGDGATRTLHAGATARSVARHSRAPVAIVPSDTAWNDVDRVVVGVDGDGADAPALAWAAEDAVRRGVELVVVRADPAGGDDARRIVDAALGELGQRPGLTVRAVIARTDPAPALLDAAGAHGVIVVGRRHRNAAAAFALGTCSRQLLRRAAVAVVVVEGTGLRCPA